MLGFYGKFFPEVYRKLNYYVGRSRNGETLY